MNKNFLEFSIGGMHCAACSARIERVLGAMPELRSASVSLASNTARVELMEGTNPQALQTAVMEAVARLGFTAEPLSAGQGGEGSVSLAAERWAKRSREQQADLAARKRDLVPAFFFALPLLILSMGEMSGMPLPDAISPRLHPFMFALIQLLLCLPVLWAGRRFFTQGLPALARRSPNMDSLVALGTGTAFIFSLGNTFRAAMMPVSAHAPSAHMLPAPGIWDMFFGEGHAAYGVDLYYESAAMVIALISLGKYLESRSRLRGSEALKGLLELAPETAFRLKKTEEGQAPGVMPPDDFDGSASAPPPVWEEVTLSKVLAGDILLVRPGSRMPVDGTVLEGSSFVDESMLTGESMPVEKGPGALLTGGSMNQQGRLVMRAERVGADTALARIVRLVQEAQGSKAPIASLADQVSYYFVPAVMVIATVAGLGWLLFGDSPAFALRVFVSVMIIACPCAMGLATPMAIMVGAGRAAQLGLLFKSGDALEHSSRITTLVFDKTGTLTEGKPSLTEIKTLTNKNPETLLCLAASLEQASEHPLARALVKAAQEKNIPLLPVEDFFAAPGKGVLGRVRMEESPHHVAVGNPAFIREHLARNCEAAELSGTACPLPDPALEPVLGNYAARGWTPVILLLDGQPEAVFAIADTLRKDTPAAIAAVKELGIDCIMLTGDNERTARAVAAEAGIDAVIAGVLPDGKEAAIADLQQQGRIVGMVGDGINDAPALARADVGFAVKSGIDIAAESGDVVLMRGDLASLVTALGLGRAVMRIIRENLFWAFGYNIIGIPFAAGLLHIFGGPALSPMLAGAAMALSSVSVVTNSLRLRFFTAKI